MNNMSLKIYRLEEIQNLKELGDKRTNGYLGYFYVIEWGDNVKIGSTANPFQRIKELTRAACKYGNVTIGGIAFSPPHTNYRANETALHRRFADARIGDTELFDVSFGVVVREASEAVTYKDESNELKMKDAESSERFRRGLIPLFFPALADAEGSEKPGDARGGESADADALSLIGHDELVRMYIEQRAMFDELHESYEELSSGYEELLRDYKDTTGKVGVFTDLYAALCLAEAENDAGTDFDRRPLMKAVVAKHRSKEHTLTVMRWSKFLASAEFGALSNEIDAVVEEIENNANA